ncbi:hypothetical protein MUK42_28253, partial [Musa troglodytarum]
EGGEAKIGGFERRILPLVQEEEVLGLEISVHHPHGVAAVDNVHDLPAQGGGRPLGVVPPGDDAVEELAALAQLHHQVHRPAILEGTPELDDVAVAGEVVHDLHLAADVLEVVPVRQLAGGDGLASEDLTGVPVRDEVGDAELAAAELATEGVRGVNVLHGATEDPADAAAATAATSAEVRAEPVPPRAGLLAVVGVAAAGGVVPHWLGSLWFALSLSLSLSLSVSNNRAKWSTRPSRESRS